jgi:hypothetical protein
MYSVTISAAMEGPLQQVNHDINFELIFLAYPHIILCLLKSDNTIKIFNLTSNQNVMFAGLQPCSTYNMYYEDICIKDLDRALDCGYPKPEFTYRLMYLRKAL